MDCDKPEETERQAEGMTAWRTSMRDFAHPRKKEGSPLVLGRIMIFWIMIFLKTAGIRTKIERRRTGMSQLSHEKTLEIIQASFAAADRGDFEEEHRLIQLLPMPATLAMAYKETFGVEALQRSGFDLSEAEEIYGNDWLAR
jgi:hypothetical protein